jgi:hypothetical protein
MSFVVHPHPGLLPSKENELTGGCHLFLNSWQLSVMPPLSTLSRCVGREVTNGGGWRNEGNGYMNRISGLLSRPVWFDVYIHFVKYFGYGFSHAPEWIRNVLEPQGDPSASLRVKMLPLVAVLNQSLAVFHPDESLSHTSWGNGIQPPDFPLIPEISSGYRTFTPFSTCGLSSVWTVE